MIPKTLIPYFLSASIAFGTGWTANGWRLSGDVAEAEARATKINALVSRAEAALERSRADQNAKAVETQRRQSRRLADVQARLGEAQRERDAAHAQLTEVLTHATDANPLSTAVLEYLDRVRGQQGH
jgi:hypothetical protein